MRRLSRVVFATPDGLLRLTVLCAGCLTELRSKTADSGVQFTTKDYGPGSGLCEFCQAEIHAEVGAL